MGIEIKNKGFTLAELLIAAAILAFVLTSLLLLFVNCLFLNDNNRNRSIAMGHAQYIMEDIKNYTLSASVLQISMVDSKIKSGYWNLNTATINSTHGLRPLRNETIVALADSSNPLFVNLTVTWKSMGQTTDNRTLNLGTQLSK